MAVYRPPIFHCVIACVSFFILGLGIGLSVPLLRSKIAPPVPAIVLTPTITPSIAESTPSEDKLTITLYFNNSNFNPNVQDCSAVFPIKRQIPLTKSILRATLDELFQGPNKDESVAGFNSVFTSATKNLVKSVNVKDGEVFIDFNKDALLKAIESGANSSCGGAQFKNSIEKTLLQIKGITMVSPGNFSINGSRAAYRDLMQ